MRNRLDRESSPYLLEHSANPIHWQPWDEDALAEARKRSMPILLSVGYSACHCCHVMARESFEDPETAALMNRLFVNIKVDREERPDIDSLYQNALAGLGEQRGWPLTMFLTPDGQPYGGAVPISRPSRATAGRRSATCCNAWPLPMPTRRTKWGAPPPASSTRSRTRRGERRATPLRRPC